MRGGQKKDGPWDPWEHQWGKERHHRRRHGREPNPEEAAERFAEAVEHVADKVGSALERAFESTDAEAGKAKAEEVGEKVATAISTAIGKVGDALPSNNPLDRQLKTDRKLIRKRDAANSKMAVFPFIWMGISAVILFGMMQEGEPLLTAAIPMVILGVVFGALVAKSLAWKSAHKEDIGRAEERLASSEAGGKVAVAPEDGATPDAPTQPEPSDAELDSSSPDSSVSAEFETADDEEGVHSHFYTREPTANARLDVVELEALQVMDLVREMGEDRPDILRSVERTVAKNRELKERRARLETILEDPDLARLDDRIEDLEARITETEDPATRGIYERTLEQLRVQDESLADVRLMLERVEAYSNASLQSLRTIHIDLLRLQTGDLGDPANALDEISTRAGNLSLETKGVREVVDEVERARLAAGRSKVRQL